MLRRLLLGGLALLALPASCSSPKELTGIDRSADTGGAGYCRATTCSPPLGYPTDDGQCEPPDWSESDACRGKGYSNAPLWWRSACVGYDLNAAASRQIPFDQASAAVAGAFAAWRGATCPLPGDSSRPSIDVRDLGPVACADRAYDSNGPNQNVIVFHDDAWPYEDADRKATHSPVSLTVALTTASFDSVTGELYDADIELNSADYTFTTTGGNGYDLQSVVTHETGHFLGLAHSPRPDAVMYASGDSGTNGVKRDLTLEDVRGICSIYPSDGTRSVSTIVDGSGRVAQGACDPTPRHGFSTTCP